MVKFINPFTDVGFKRIFGQEINKDLLIDFLNSLLVGERHIHDIQFLDKEILGENVVDRSCIYDIYCTDENGNQFIVEMQNRHQAFFRDRSIYYMARAISRQGERGLNWRFNLKAVYGIFFINFKLEDLKHKLRTDICLEDRDTHELFSDKMRFIFLQLPMFDKTEDECENDFERWIYVLKNMDTLQRLPFKARNAVFQKLEEIVSLASLSEEERLVYDKSAKVYRDNLATELYAVQRGIKEGFEQGLQQGIEQGLQQGIEQGLQQGIEQGLQQGIEQEKIDIARRMKAKGYTDTDIAGMTGLPLAVIATL
ncbi:MAG TPA: Rpn family recombination-promoting nuclease/putative transposase [Candidatus Bacteroides pullicola]|uniref:Rpn family recombination-promoting nuclease/putative transposase n=1 Tax=Candidatus Bacteroides pullicola TaxID=2838475 RepID=A0A9D1ZG94_9BACE|nr:Rpn family recombination-promoting nuclease/putative transposase [Candidatus Bacteroides pullicola]